ncbi:hypothetical protein PUN28_014933 [Cardiocondyla obscurior]|uniref:Uncharacterized protein n=1 Tax=Cardiocondyla obscurior TaxID=286306 RepID=A0AAW2F181_9HYME
MFTSVVHQICVPYSAKAFSHSTRPFCKMSKADTRPSLFVASTTFGVFAISSVISLNSLSMRSNRSASTGNCRRMSSDDMKMLSRCIQLFLPRRYFLQELHLKFEKENYYFTWDFLNYKLSSLALIKVAPVRACIFLSVSVLHCGHASKILHNS